MATALALFVLSLVVAAFGFALSWISQSREPDLQASTRRDPESIEAEKKQAAENALEKLIEAVNQKLPQTQCAQCGYPGCRPYAQAIVMDDVAINQCPPGGDALIGELADFLGKDAPSLDASRGEHKPPQVALINESTCIGCTLCIAACPVDAIVGAARQMHTIVADQCTGCELCLPPCPVDCIELIPQPNPLAHWYWPKPS